MMEVVFELYAHVLWRSISHGNISIRLQNPERRSN